MKLRINKIRTAFSKKNTANPQEDADYIKAIMNDIEETPFALSSKNVMYAAFSELGGYYFMQTIVIGGLQLKTRQGAQLNFIDKDFELALRSDMSELASEHTHVRGRNITRIDFQIEETDVKKVMSLKPSELVLTAHKEIITFKKHLNDAAS